MTTKHTFTQNEIDNFTLIKSYAYGEYSEQEHNGILFVPKFLISEEMIKSIEMYIFELDGKHSQVEADIEILDPKLAPFNLEYDFDEYLAELVLDKVSDVVKDIKLMKSINEKYPNLENKIDPNNLINNYELNLEDLQHYQELVIESLKTTIKLNDSETKLLSQIQKTQEKLKDLTKKATPNLLAYMEVNSI